MSSDPQQRPEGPNPSSPHVPDVLTPGITVWGGGYIGLSTAAHYARFGIPSLIYDTDGERVRIINSGQSGLVNFESWLGTPIRPMISSGLIRATRDPDEAIRPGVHFVAVPTERNGLPWLEAVLVTVKRVAQAEPSLCVIESTLTPGSADRLLERHEGLPLVVAPRRDWFLGPGRSVADLPRVYGAGCDSVAELAAAVLALVSPKLVRARSCATAELSKCLENGLHHVAAMYATQMARAYPSIDVNEAFALAATHWRVKNRYFASAGTGGYCLPVATRYLEEGAPVPEALTIGRAASDFEVDQRAFVADLLMRRATGPVGILGLSYRADLPAWTLSPFVDVARRLCGAGVDVRLHDPIISWQSIVGLESATPLKFPTGLAACSVLFLGAAHSQYRTELEAWLALNLQRGQIVVDNEGAWEGASGKFGEAGVEYLRIGGAKWTLVEAAT